MWKSPFQPRNKTYKYTDLKASGVSSSGDTRRRVCVTRFSWKYREACTIVERDAHDVSSTSLFQCVSASANWRYTPARKERVAAAVNGTWQNLWNDLQLLLFSFSRGRSMTAYRRGINANEQLLLAEVLNQSTSDSVWRKQLAHNDAAAVAACIAHLHKWTNAGPESERAHFSPLPLPLLSFLLPFLNGVVSWSAANIRGSQS